MYNVLLVIISLIALKTRMISANNKLRHTGEGQQNASGASATVRQTDKR